MLIYEYKLHGSKAQYGAIDEAIRITQFIRNKCLRLWADTRGTNKNDLQCYCAVLAKEFPLIAVEPAYTSQDCSACGTRVKKSLSVRTHTCSGCGMVLDRDHNAAINILARALDRTGGQSETGIPKRIQNASGQTAATRSRRASAGKQAG